MRKLNVDLVRQRTTELVANPPGATLRLTAWMEPGVYLSDWNPGWVFWEWRRILRQGLVFSFYHLSFLASNNYFVLSGQHLFAATQLVNQQRTLLHLPMFKYDFLLSYLEMGRMENVDENFQFFRWCQEFLVLVVKSDTDKETRTNFS